MKKLISLLSLILSFGALSHAQTTAIPDTDFEQKLIALGIDSDGIVNGQILNSDAAAVTTLNVWNSNISDLTGIEAFVNLDTLNCSSNSLNNLDLSANIALTTLKCYSNQLSSLNLTTNTALFYLDCSSNPLNNLNLSANIALSILRCTFNQLSNLDLSANTALTTLLCTYNQLTSLDLSANTALRELYCFANQLSSLDLSNSAALEELQCYNNPLSNLDLSNSTGLLVLDCNNNQLSSLDLSTNVALTNLTCHTNQLTSLDLSKNTALVSLNCNTNQLSSLNLTTNTALFYLDCSENQLSSLNLSANVALASLYCMNNQLSSLDVSNNIALTNITCENNQLNSLDVSNNTILTNLSCGSNQLSSLDISNNIALRNLYCRENLLSSLDLSVNLALSFLDFSNNQLSSLDISHLLLLEQLFCSNNNLSKLDITNNTKLYRLFCQNNLPFMRICVADTFSFLSVINSADWQKDPTTNYTKGCFPKAIEGRITIDANSNCTSDSLEQGLSGVLLQFVSNSDTNYFASYDTLGNYTAYLDTGVYTVSVVAPNVYWQVCPSSQQVTVDTNYSIQTLDWSLQSLISCPMLKVDIAAPFLRMTGSGSNYIVSYSNKGTVAAQNAYVEVDIDPALNILNTSLPIASQVGNNYRFNIGNVAVGEWGEFSIQVLVDTTALFEQTHCTEAHIYPDSTCIPVWIGSIASTTASCQNDSVYFRVDNIGAAMLQPQQYFVFEDNIVMRTGTVQLGANQFVNIIQAAELGKTYRIEVEQSTGFPAMLGDSVAMASIEGCNPFANGSFNTGFITQLSNGNSSPFVAVDCQQNVASYDPNDKAAQPAGYGAAHYIYKNTAIDYKVRFQNTGTDTAFNIVILDTLSAHVDIASLTMGASSHNYTWTIQDGNVLRVNFYNVMLPDSNVNEPLSNGFFRYRIEQQPNNPNGTVIENTAAIYFDYNPAIFTNTTFHTIGENFVSVNIITSAAETLAENVAVKVYPNPFKEQATLEVEGGNYQELKLKIYDTMGRYRLQSVSTEDNKIQIQRGNLPQGVYIYRLEGDGELINTGKIIIQ